ncbi:hypothetical protein E4U43_006261 [Claviceps pusilla]|uniref:Trafficking protein particle complex II-specific subunit 65 IgD3 domain-containing protein n=1 Tax=Claviceps pusilla TaxID=123648 RepID=A0A9P7T2D3_9HYPO|nr:hypothetical protein E4U43_006261 [Claviceps pusilla]
MPGTDDTVPGDDVAKPVDDANNDNDVNDANDSHDTDAHDADVNDANIATSNISSDFIDQSYLTYVVPLRTNLDLDQAFKDADAGKSILDSLQQRDALYFDETVEVVLILKMPWSEADVLQAQIKRLVISLEAQIVNSSPERRDSQPAAEIIFKGHVDDVADPFIIVDQEESESEDASSQNVYAMWKLPVYLARPRMRPQHSAVIFSASASLKPQVMGESSTRGTGYLQSGVPSSFNLLEPFSSDPALGGVKPRLSALRVSRVSPVSRQQDLVAHLRALPQLRIPVYPIIHTRLRLSRPSSVPPQAALIAMLEIDLTHYAKCEILLDDVTLRTADGTILSLNNDDGDSSNSPMKLPMTCVAHDHITFLYHIKPHQREKPLKSFTGSLDIAISATAQVVPGICTPRLVMSWTTALEFTTPVNPNFNTMADSTGIQRAHKPSHLAIGSNTAAAASSTATVMPFKAPSALRSDAVPGPESSTAAPRNDKAAVLVPDLGITMSFTAPSHPIYPGDLFSWTVHVVNRSPEHSTRPPRKFALVALPKRRRTTTTTTTTTTDTRPAHPPATPSRRVGEAPIARAVLDTTALHALQKNSPLDTTEVICLSADTRVGPLAPGSCHVAELQFLALRAGIVGIEAVRVVDMGSQEHVDIRDLPTMMVESPTAC